ncbi:MAG: ExbD/TolR family protein [Limisphaerales bacterium]
MRYPRNAKIFRGQLDAAPFAGVFFCLLLFILLASNLVFTPGVKIDLAQADDFPGVTNPSLVVAVSANGAYYFRNRSIAEGKLKQELRGAVLAANGNDEKLVLVALLDEEVDSQALVRLAEIARQAGITEMLQATRPRFEATDSNQP